MRTRTLIKQFTWRADDRADVTLGPSTRLVEERHRAELVFDEALGSPPGTGAFPTAADLFVKSRLTTPKAVRSWSGFEAFVEHASDEAGAVVTAVLFRLDDGTDERYWDGGAWAVAGASDWNSEQVIADNIAAWDVATLGQSMRVVVNLSTSDGEFTPALVEVRLAYEAIIDFQEDILYRSLIPLLKTGIRPITRAPFAMLVTGLTFNISDLGLETGYNVVDVDAVFDFDALGAQAQQDMLRGFVGAAPDLLSSFVVGTGVVTLTGSVTAGVNLYVRLVVQPRVAVWTSQEFSSPGKVPSIRLVDIEAIDMVEAPAADCSVANKAAGTAVVVPSPQQGDLTFTLLGQTEKGVDHQRLLEEVNRFFADNPFLFSTGLDEGYRLHLIDEYRMLPTQGQDEIHTGEAIFLVKHFRRWLKPAFTDTLAVPPSYDGEAQSPILNQRNQGSVLEGRGPWNALWTGDAAGGVFWPGVPRYDGSTFELLQRRDAFGGANRDRGLVTPRHSTSPFDARAIGPNRVNRAVRFAGHGRYQLGPDTPDASTPLPAGPTGLFTWRGIFKDENTTVVSPDERRYVHWHDGALGFALTRPDADDLTIEMAGYIETLAGALTPFKGGQMLVDINYDHAADQLELFINGTPIAVPAGGAPGARAMFAAGGTYLMWNGTGLTAASDGIVGLSQGIALGRIISIADHTADAAALGV